MKADEILSSEDFKKCLDFHGHICPGLAIGYRAAKAGLEWYEKNGSKADPMVAIVETGGCSADMFQVLAGCTFGNGGLVHKDNGKQVFNLVGRHSQSGVRIAMKPGVFQPTEENVQMIDKIINDEATEEQHEKFHNFALQKCRAILEMPLEDLFEIKSINVSVPRNKIIEAMKVCDKCNEPTLISRLTEVDDRFFCNDCLNAG